MKKIYLTIPLLLLGCTDPNFNYPESEKKSLSFEAHNETINDPYLYMEDCQNLEVIAWADKQNEFTNNYLSGPKYDELHKQIKEAYSSEYYSMSFFDEESDYYYYNSGDNQHNQYIRKDDNKIILDPDTWSEDQTLNLASVSMSPDKKFLAYAVSDGGVDWRTINVIDLETMEELATPVTEVKFSSIDWSQDSQGFYYNKYPKPEEKNRLCEPSLNAAIYYFDISTGKSSLFYGEQNPEENYSLSFVGEDNIPLIRVINGSEEENHYIIKRDDVWELATPKNVASFNYQDSDAEGLFFLTNFEAANYRLVKVLFTGEILEIIPETALALKSVSILEDFIITNSINTDMNSFIEFHSKDGELLNHKIPNDIQGTLSSFSMHKEKLRFSVSNFINPTKYIDLDLDTLDYTIVWQDKVSNFDPADYKKTFTYYESKDGTMVPLTYFHKKDLDISAETPIFLYGYGGYNISIRPSFSRKYVGWLELGGIVAIANLRGGGELGKKWHNAGRLKEKQNVFDDFLYASKYLEASGIGNRKSTVISGRSNGGLLVGTSLVQNPNYFGATLPAVGVLDMLRFTEFTEGWGWRGDYGSPLLSKEDFDFNFDISPYHQLTEGECYSPTLVTTGRRDDRVVPSHSYKFTARIQEFQDCNNPVMLIDTVRAGHGSGGGAAMPKWKRIELFTSEQAFALKNLKKY
jgi:prolyl oligopeptidase